MASLGYVALATPKQTKAQAVNNPAPEAILASSEDMGLFIAGILIRLIGAAKAELSLEAGHPAAPRIPRPILPDTFCDSFRN